MAFFFPNKLVLQPFGALKASCKFVAFTEMGFSLMVVFHLVLEYHAFCLCGDSRGVFPSPKVNIFWPMLKDDNTLFGYELGFDISFALTMFLIICCAAKFGMGLKLLLGVSEEDSKSCKFWFLINLLNVVSGAVFLICKTPYYKNNLILAGSDWTLFLYQLLSLWMIHQFLIALKLRNDEGKGKEDNIKEKNGNNDISPPQKIRIYIIV